jgi:outer membrane lipoprotein carrier protein
MTRATAAALALGLLAAAPAAQQQQPAAGDLARRIQARYESVRDFTAAFTQTTRSALLPQTSVTSGTVKIRKPGLMRWEYVEPEKQTVGSDGTDFYVYVPADRVVTYSALPKPGEEDTALLFLAGRGNLATDYITRLPAEQPAGQWRLALTPRRAQDDYSVVVLMVDRRDLRLLGLEWSEHDGGGSTIRFTNYRENVGLKPAEFQFTRPRGVEAIRR